MPETSCDSAAWRCATACSCTARPTGPPRCARAAARSTVASGRKPDLGAAAAERVPGVRGVIKLAEAMAVIPLVKRALPEARLPMQDAKTLGAMGAAALGGQAVRSRGRAPGVAREAAVALISLAPGADGAAQRRPGRLPRRRAQGDRRLRGRRRRRRRGQGARPLRLAPGRADADRGGARQRRRCAARACAGRPPRPSSGWAAPPWPWRSSPGPSAIPTAALTRLLRLPGHEIQRAVGTREPTAEQLEVGRAALDGDPPGRGRRRLSMATQAGRRTRLDPSVFRLPVERIRDGYYSDAYFNFTRQLLAGARPAPARDDAGVPEARVDPRRHRRGDRRAQALQRRLGRSSRCTRSTRATRSPRWRRS